MLYIVVISDGDVCCSVVIGTRVGVFVFSVISSELLICSVVCLSQLFCSALMCCLEEVYRCLQL